jgi:hypothetical protein
MPAPRLTINDRERGTSDSFPLVPRPGRVRGLRRADQSRFPGPNARTGTGAQPRNVGRLLGRFLPAPPSNTPRRGGPSRRRRRG